MHTNPAVKLGCTDCHGGNANLAWPAGGDTKSRAYAIARDKAHVLPRFPESWKYPSSANPERTYSLLNKEAPEFIRFINPGDYRIARESCGACHLKTIQAAERSLMATTAMFWGGAAYNNGLLPNKQYVLGEAYTRDGQGGDAREARRRRDEDRDASRPHRQALSACRAGKTCRRRTSSACSSAAGATSSTCSRRRGCPTRSGRSSGSKNRAAPISRPRIAGPEPAGASPCRC